MSKANGSNRIKMAHCVALLRDGPLTAVGAAEMLGVSVQTVTDYFEALRVAGVAKVDSQRKNTNGLPTAIWSFVPAEEAVA